MEKNRSNNEKTIFIFIFAVALLSFTIAVPHNYPNFAQASFTIDNNVLSISDDIIYNTGYYSVNGGSWTSFPLQGTPYGGEHPWLLDSGMGNVNLPSTGTHYVIVFSCSLANNGQSWDCHENKWQLDVIDNQGSNPPSDETPNTLVSVSTQEFYGLIQTREDAILLDLRTSGEYNQGHIEDAQNIDFYADNFETQLSGLDKQSTYLIYCRSGSRSGQTLQIMRGLNFEEVYDLDFGINDWIARGYAVV